MGPHLNQNIMKATQLLHNLGQSLWLDNITRDLLNSGTLKSYIDELSVTGLTSNPTIFDHAIKKSSAYDDAILKELATGRTDESLFFDLALDDLTRAADLFRPIYDRTNGVDGWVSLEVSPLLAHDTSGTIKAAKELSQRAGRPNLFIKIPGTKEGLPAIEESIFAGIPINVTLTTHCRWAQPPGRLRGLDVHQPLGCCGGGQDSGGVKESTRYCDIGSNLQSLPRFVGQSPVSAYA